MTDDLLKKALRYRWLIFWILALSYILVYFHRLCPAVVALDMMQDLKAGGGLVGLLGAAYFYPYALMQPPAGGAVFQPVLGHVLEKNGRIAGAFTLAGYKQAFLILFLCGIITLGASLCLRETMGKE